MARAAQYLAKGGHHRGEARRFRGGVESGAGGPQDWLLLQRADGFARALLAQAQEAELAVLHALGGRRRAVAQVVDEPRIAAGRCNLV